MAKVTADGNFCDFCIPLRLQILAANLGEESLNVARHLGLQNESISWIAHIHKEDLDHTDMAFQLLESCAAQNKSMFFKRLEKTLSEEGREDLLLLMRNPCLCNKDVTQLQHKAESKTSGYSRMNCCEIRRCNIL
jgi:hypothetical protein